ncbi:hypothetical protein Syun_000834 [Stephania yunnanensis]|uniref:Uncharacterized protein n=1 Tax=Stephania yunnanensis TaxID=152371 RepID=A0AAP0LI88_9MAGN
MERVAEGGQAMGRGWTSKRRWEESRGKKRGRKEKAVKDRRAERRGLGEGPARALRGTVEAGTATGTVETGEGSQRDLRGTVEAGTAAGTVETGEGSQRPEHRDDPGEASKQEEISVRQRQANREEKQTGTKRFFSFKPTGTSFCQEVVTQGHDFCLLAHTLLTWR